MKRALLVLLLLSTISAQAYIISDYPAFFVKDGKFKAIYVIGEEAPALDVVSATVISTALAKYPNVTTEIGTSRIDSEIADITKENAIVIGSPCENLAALKLEGNPEPCHKNLAGSTGYIKLFENNGKVQLLITGLTAEDRHQTAKFLAGKSIAILNTKEYLVPTATNSVPPKVELNKEPKELAETVKQEPAPKLQTTELKTTNDQPPTTNQQPVGDYEPLEELPAEKNIFVRFWNWLMRLF